MVTDMHLDFVFKHCLYLSTSVEPQHHEPVLFDMPHHLYVLKLKPFVWLVMYSVYNAFADLL